jgi:DNA ligase-associated metallophosphoesterase
MTQPCTILVNGETLCLEPSGAVWWAAEKTLVVADLHFEKGSSYARSGQFLPPYDTRATLKRIAVLVARHNPARVIALGDSFHDDAAGDRLDGEEIAMLGAMTHRLDWIWVEGNHDPNPPTWLGGSVVAEFSWSGLTFRHIPCTEPCVGEVAGHIHPAVRVNRNGLSLWRRSFVSDGLRLVMPAFGAYTGGFDVREEAVTSLFAREPGVFAMGREKVYAVSGACHALLRKKNVDAQPNATAISTVERP